ncbi:putative quinol monooxygenase [Pseudoxanthomonas sangjuensis]|uniref:putative quinol monooxygenase n=1 Tax=Pseudoxanthomonas sangjuensis TaxID=1503750 RepID=UPI001391C410|nr:antibiotic biosynthesis monooxygenase family protein [Pseudoxanthomonas sangjuensis]
MFVAVWEFEVREECIAEFVALYGGDGEWAALFRKHAGYLDTELLRDAGNPTRFLTIDRWTSQAAYDDFLASAKPDYAAIDALGEAFTVSERLVGRFATA